MQLLNRIIGGNRKQRSAFLAGLVACTVGGARWAERFNTEEKRREQRRRTLKLSDLPAYRAGLPETAARAAALWVGLLSLMRLSSSGSATAQSLVGGALVGGAMGGMAAGVSADTEHNTALLPSPTDVMDFTAFFGAVFAGVGLVISFIGKLLHLVVPKRADPA